MMMSKSQIRKLRKFIDSVEYKNLFHIFKFKKNEDNEIINTFSEGDIADMFNFTTSIIGGKKLNEIFPQEHYKMLNEKYEEAFSGKNVGFELKISETWFQTHLFPVFSSDNKVKEIIGESTITNFEKKIEIDIKKQKQRLENIIEGTNLGTWEWNIKTGETIFNEKWANIIGYTLEELDPIDINVWNNFCHPNDLKISNKLLDDHFNGKSEHYECEVRIKHKNGNWIWVIDRGKVINWDEYGKPLTMFGTHTDITNRKKMQDTIIENEKQRSLSIMANIIPTTPTSFPKLI